jgi:transposase
LTARTVMTLIRPRVVLEATGGYKGKLLAALMAARIETRRVNPREIHHFARAAGQLAKTDRIDARMLALFAERIRPPARALSDPERSSSQSGCRVALRLAGGNCRVHAGFCAHSGGAAAREAGWFCSKLDRRVENLLLRQ